MGERDRNCGRRSRFDGEQAFIQIDVKVTAGLMAGLDFHTCVTTAAGQFGQLNGNARDGANHVILADQSHRHTKGRDEGKAPQAITCGRQTFMELVYDF